MSETFEENEFNDEYTLIKTTIDSSLRIIKGGKTYE